jgi:formate/nitrite transporter FocA (FNT family)
VGASVAFGGLLPIIVGGGIPAIKSANPGLQKFVFGAVFSVGLMLVVVAGGELFTGKMAVSIPSVLFGRIRSHYRNHWQHYRRKFFVGVIYWFISEYKDKSDQPL